MPNALPPRDRAEGPPKVERLDEFKKRCGVCGQVFDTRDQNQVFHHDGRAHAPLKAQH